MTPDRKGGPRGTKGAGKGSAPTGSKKRQTQAAGGKAPERARGPARPTQPERPEAPERPSDGAPNEPEQPQDFEFLVRGQVLYRHGLPLEGAKVVAFHKELRRELEIGSADTDGAGNYEIYYSADKLPGKTADLLMRAYDGGGRSWPSRRSASPRGASRRSVCRSRAGSKRPGPSTSS